MSEMTGSSGDSGSPPRMPEASRGDSRASDEAQGAVTGFGAARQQAAWSGSAGSYDSYGARRSYAAEAPYPGATQQMMPPAYAAAERKRGRGWIVAIVAIIAVAVLLMFGMASCTSAVTMPFSLLSSDDSSGVEGISANSIAVITLDGTIQYDGTECSPEGLKYLLDAAEANDRIKAVVLRVNSGGGTATAGEEMAGYIAGFSKPIVVSSASTNASAAYEISSQADYIFVARSTLIGSIGTAIEFANYSGLMELLGIEVETITSSDSKDSTYGYRALTDEERAHYQAIVDQINDTFVAMVAEGRGMSEDEVRALANGLSYTGIDAVENGLADEIGTLEDAIAYAAWLAGLDTYASFDLTLDDGSGFDLLSLIASMSGMGSQETKGESTGNVLE